MWHQRLKLPEPRPSFGTRTASLRSTNPWSRKGSRITSLRRKPQNIPNRRNSIPPPRRGDRANAQSGPENAPASAQDSVSATLRDTNPQDNTLISPVHIPEDPHAVLRETHPAAGLLANSGLVVQRQLEMMNVLLGFEQANRYTILDAQGNHVGYIAEQGNSMGSMLARQWFRTHRAFVTHVFDKHQNEVLRFHRPFSWINSRIRVYDPLDVASSSHSSSAAVQTNAAEPLVAATSGDSARISSLDLADMRVVGETHSQWAPLRRKYNLFLFHPNPTPETDLHTKHVPLSNADLSQSQKLQVASTSAPGASGEFGQFAYVDEPFLSWDFSLRSADSRLIGSVNRNFVGFARELFTDTGMYALRMDAAALAEERDRHHIVSQTHKESHPLYDSSDKSGMTLDQRAVILATAVTIDFDYFSRHSSSGGLPIPLFGMGGGGGEGAASGAPGGAAGGAVEGAAAEGAAGAIGRGVAGAGTMAGYEAMQRGASADNQQQPDETQQSQDHPPPEDGAYQDEEVWGGSGQDWWNRDGGSNGGWGEEGEGDGDGDGNGWGDFF
ncbi:scramblase [Blastomyces gilchristii SLH14081]|uniref:Scramblase n=1 Tax=Blastomyces gilchristii (strain SLH14081) TaxID=559298 RepID=A0A179UBV6_BLAGS|nr:scramblase [Blastomyces gilchristii SLH14081]OAT04778.1 scramblase [Blastomyces gilchristii SLH14081]